LAGGARAAGLDRSTASRRIDALERALGARVFLRTRDGFRLSAAGERLIEHAERMTSEAHALARAASHEGGEASGLVKLATTEALAATLVRRGLLDVRAQHPGLELELLGSNTVVDLTRGGADLALRLAKIDQPSLRVRRVARWPFCAFAGDAYVRRRGRPRSERELAGHDVLLLSGELAKLPESRWLAAHSSVRVVLRTNSMIALLSALAQGAGIAVLSTSGDEDAIGARALFEVNALSPRPVYLAMHPDAGKRTAVRIIADHVADIIAHKRPA
jgi:DNA-binding transcriptional LysR family regulator